MTPQIYNWYTKVLGVEATIEELDHHNKLLRKAYHKISNPNRTHLSLGCYLFLRHTGLHKLYKRKFKRDIPLVKYNRISDHWDVKKETLKQIKEIVLRTLPRQKNADK